VIDTRITGSFKLTELRIRTRRALRQGLYRIGQGLERQVKADILVKPKSGRTYMIKTRSGRWRRHIASAPGETIANRTGAYRKSVGFKVHGQSKVEFGAGVHYAGFLENGTPRMEARPSLNNTIKARRRTMRSEIITELRKELT